jgi:signal transduction histidine kinase
MKLAWRLTFVLVFGMSLVLTAYGWVTVHRDVELFEQQRQLDVTRVGRALALAVTSTWDTDGEARARELLDQESAQETPLRFRLVWLDAKPGDPSRPDIALPKLLGRDPGAEAGIAGTDSEGVERVYTYVPVALRSKRGGALELSRLVSRVREHARRTLQDVAFMTLLATAVNILLAAFFGLWFVGRPISALVLQARRVGAGDLAARIDLRQRDELGELAREMNVMCERLEGARQRIAEETASRIATLEQLRHADRLVTVGRLAAGIAHELGTPLNVIQGRAKMVATREVEGEAALESASVVVTQAERMAAIIRHLLDFARRRAPRRSPTDLAALVRQTVELLTPLARKRGVTVAVQAADPVTIEVDSGQLQQALTNLVVNAIQATPGRGEVRVSLGKERADPPPDHGGDEAEWLTLSVADDGEGIAPENFDRIFEPFFTTKDVGEGTGLGLPVSYGIVKEHGGWIAVQSAPGKGSRFTIFLPERVACPTAS